MIWRDAYEDRSKGTLPGTICGSLRGLLRGLLGAGSVSTRVLNLDTGSFTMIAESMVFFDLACFMAHRPLTVPGVCERLISLRVSDTPPYLRPRVAFDLFPMV